MKVRITRRRRRIRPAALGEGHKDQVERRQAAAIRLVGEKAPAAGRIATAPPGYLLAHSSSDVVRHCELLAALPAYGEVRVVATPGRVPGEWHLDVGTRDRPGLLAAFTGVLHDAGIDVVQAVLATWDDGAALQALVVRSPHAPASVELEHAFEVSLDDALSSPPVADARVAFDRSGSLYTCCEVAAADRPGLLHAIAVAIAAAGVDIHAASVTTVGGMACDRFDLSDHDGRKLDAALEDTIGVGIRGGVSAACGGGRRRGY